MKHRIAVALLLVGLAVSWVDAQVPAGGEFRVNTYTTNYQSGPSIAADAAGNFVVAWESPDQDGSGWGVFAQRYDAAGQPRGGEFQVNTYTTNFQLNPSVASDPAGNFVVAWESDGLDGIAWGVFAQRYDAAGQPRGSEFQVNTHTTSWHVRPSVASDATGNFVVAWTSLGQDGSYSGVSARRYDASGTPRGAEFQVNTFTIDYQYAPSVASDAVGNFVVAWQSWRQDGSGYGVFAQRYDAAGQPRGVEFQVNTYATGWQYRASVASDAAGNFVVAWSSCCGQDGGSAGVFAQRYDAAGLAQVGEFQVNTYTTDSQTYPSVASDAAGNFVLAWQSNGQDGSEDGVFAQRYDVVGQPRGGEFQVNTHTLNWQLTPAVACVPAGSFVVAWTSHNQDGSYDGIFGRRFHGRLGGVALAVDQTATAGSDGNGILEPGESVEVKPSWRNVSGQSQTFDGAASSFTGPPAAGVSYQLLDATALYGTVDDETTMQCSDCYQVGVQAPGARPATHWDATLLEDLTADGLGQQEAWKLHVGESFTDVPKTSGYYRFVETLLHRGVTGGCSATSYCPASVVSRQQTAVFALVAKDTNVSTPEACGTTPMFADVPVTSPYCRYVEELARRGITSGCGGGNFCPTGVVTRGQMPIFVLRTLDPTFDPPACGTPMFGDLPATSPYCKWAEELARRGVVAGCGGGNFCPTAPVNRAQMAVFISATFGLTLYGP
jgi:hypothetical protein